MKSKFIFTGLLTTALIFPPVTSNLAHAASPKATETVKDKISDVDDEQETSQDRNHDDSSKESSSEKSDDSKQDKKTKKSVPTIVRILLIIHLNQVFFDWELANV